MEIRRLDLREWKRAWVYVSEYNYDVLEKSFSIERLQPPLPRLSPGFLKILLRGFGRRSSEAVHASIGRKDNRFVARAHHQA